MEYTISWPTITSLRREDGWIFILSFTQKGHFAQVLPINKGQFKVFAPNICLTLACNERKGQQLVLLIKNMI